MTRSPTPAVMTRQSTMGEKVIFRFPGHTTAHTYDAEVPSNTVTTNTLVVVLRCCMAC
jgi:hypothetical protein